MWTHIPVMYRDSSNNKDYATIVVPGAITPEQIEELRGYLRNGEYYIPSQVDLDAYGPDDYGRENYGDGDMHEMLVGEITVKNSSRVYGGGFVQSEHVTGTIQEFIARFAAVTEWVDA